MPRNQTGNDCPVKDGKWLPSENLLLTRLIVAKMVRSVRCWVYYKSGVHRICWWIERGVLKKGVIFDFKVFNLHKSKDVRAPDQNNTEAALGLGVGTQDVEKEILF